MCTHVPEWITYLFSFFSLLSLLAEVSLEEAK